MKLTIRPDDLQGPEVLALLQQHLDLMFSITPPESVHALDVDSMRGSEVAAWTAWYDDRLAGCGALKQIEPDHGEIKSMHTAAAFRGQGVAAAILRQILDVARQRGYRRLSLETGAMQEFAPARSLYRAHGFTDCSPFGDYAEDPNSVFMTLAVKR